MFSTKNLSWISSACSLDLAANFAKTNGKGANTDKSGTEKCVSEPKDYVEAEGFRCDETAFFGEKNAKDVHYKGGKGTAKT
ncbi:hypothetical protein AVEN_243861-1 [Araneus ventricosus]|uniref:Uncharacterized protein n=1 Tax=Araneus ventricosus TaxID=182803 RepID=A0A4Y2A762_ARAVE|nr:hypothetical protein AVEN_243861-1 [Araneus ventricosus]